MQPGTISWTSPRNHIRVHSESLLYNRDPEQLAADVIGLSEKYAALATEHVSRFGSRVVLMEPSALPSVMPYVPFALPQVLWRSFCRAADTDIQSNNLSELEDGFQLVKQKRTKNEMVPRCTVIPRCTNGPELLSGGV